MRLEPQTQKDKSRGPNPESMQKFDAKDKKGVISNKKHIILDKIQGSPSEFYEIQAKRQNPDVPGPESKKKLCVKDKKHMISDKKHMILDKFEGFPTTK